MTRVQHGRVQHGEGCIVGGNLAQAAAAGNINSLPDKLSPRTGGGGLGRRRPSA